MKLGGVNHLLDDDALGWLRERRTMVCGAHLAVPTSGTFVGITALVASVDAQFVHYPASIRIQQPDTECGVLFFVRSVLTRGMRSMIRDMEYMMIERLLLYKKKNNALPEKIILFRPGISEGQFGLVLQYELPGIERAFAAVYGSTVSHPTLSIVACTKSHNVNLLPTSAGTASQNGNTRPGTVVDKGITDVYRYDFYLQVSTFSFRRRRGTDPRA
jgi:eukaryotic translation initiation factor 2C